MRLRNFRRKYVILVALIAGVLASALMFVAGGHGDTLRFENYNRLSNEDAQAKVSEILDRRFVAGSPVASVTQYLQSVGAKCGPLAGYKDLAYCKYTHSGAGLAGFAGWAGFLILVEWSILVRHAEDGALSKIEVHRALTGV